MEKIIVALDNLLEIQISLLDKSGLRFQKGESSLNASKNTKEESKKPIENNINNKREIQAIKKQIQLPLSKQKNQQQETKQNQESIKQ